MGIPFHPLLEIILNAINSFNTMKWKEKFDTKLTKYMVDYLISKLKIKLSRVILLISWPNNMFLVLYSLYTILGICNCTNMVSLCVINIYWPCNPLTQPNCIWNEKEETIQCVVFCSELLHYWP